MNADKSKTEGLYKATQMWTNIIQAFKTGIPLRKHWKNMRPFDNCFTGQEAVEWLFNWLSNNPDFAPKVSKEQTKYLLHKLHRAGVFEDVNSKKLESSEVFKETGRLYRVSNKSPLKIIRTPGRPPLWNRNRASTVSKQVLCEKRSVGKENETQNASNNLTDCHVMVKTLTIDEIHHIWKTTTLGRLQSLLNVSSIDSFLNSQSVKGSWIVHNMTRISENGVVMVLDKSDDLPHWVLSAMKCLIHWPNASGSGSCLPNYPGFENDVLKVVRDYFTTLDKPLTTHELYDALLSCFIQAEMLDISHRSQSTIQIPASPSVEDMLSSISSCNYQKTSTPNAVSELKPLSNSRESLAVSQKWHSLNRNQTKKRLKQLDIRSRASYACSRFSSDSHSSGLCYETAFMSNGPVTRVISVNNSCRPRSIAVSNSKDNSSYDSAHSHLSNNQSNNIFRQEFQTRSSLKYQNLVSPCSSSHENTPEQKNIKDIVIYENLKDVSPILSQSANNLSDQQNDRTPYGKIPPYLKEGVLTHYRKSPSKRCLVKENTLSILNATKTSIPGLLTPEGKLRGIQTLQYLCLLLPPNNRKKLHLLLKFISKTSSNKRLVLCSDTPSREMLLTTFTSAILLPPPGISPDPSLAIRIASFLVDNYEDIMRPPPLLRSQVTDRIAALQRSQVCYGFEPQQVRYCNLITPAQYEEQRLTGSQLALVQLLQDIIKNETFTPKTRRKQLKKFKQSHPNIYSEHFGATDPLLVHSGHTKFPKLKSLTKLATLRL